MAMVKGIHWKVNGRTRYQVDGLRNAPKMKTYLESALGRLPEIVHVSASEVTGNVLVTYNSYNSHHGVGRLIEGLVETYPPQSSPGKAPEQAPDSDFAPDHDRLGIPIRTHAGLPLPADMLSRPWHQNDAEAVLAFTGTALHTGLTNAEAAERLRNFGLNHLPETPPRSVWGILFGQLNSLPVYLLGAAAGISVLTGGLLDAAIIMGVVATNAVIGYLTESRAERTIQSLKKLVHPVAEVIRDGQAVPLPAREVTLGDLLVLKPGMFVSADCRIVLQDRLSTDESMLTGESMPVYKQSVLLTAGAIPLADRTNMAFMGTLVTGGSGIAVVVATGRDTEIGRLQALLEGAEAPATPMERQLGRLGDQLVLMCLGVCGVVFLIGLLRGHGLVQMARTAISLAASAVPEGLPAAATINLALGIGRMRQHHVLVRSLQAVETLGAVQTICLDKTGTVTRNRMAVQALYVGGKCVTVRDQGLYGPRGRIPVARRPDLQRLMAICALCNETKINGPDTDGELIMHGSSTEKALLHMVQSAGMDLSAFLAAHTLVEIRHRAESRLFMSTTHRTENGRRLLCVKGSPPEVLALCDRLLVGGKTLPLDDATRLTIQMENERMAGSALRVLGFAYKETANGPPSENGLTWTGLAGMADPVRPHVRELIGLFHRAGVETVLITGDQSDTAYAVAQELNLSRERPMEIMDATALDALAPEMLQALATKVHVFARVSPAHKLKIVQALQAAGRTVAMTGDGINDGPALKAADIGIAMGREGTDVARDIADIVLQEDQLEFLAQALAEGRTIHSNIRKSVRFFLSTNISEVMLMFTAMGLGIGFPLNVMQLLWINLISDIFPGLALAMETPEADVMQRPPRDSRGPLFDRRDFAVMTRESAVITGGALAAFGYGALRHGAGVYAGTMAFQSLTIAQLLHALVCRSEHRTIGSRAPLPPNPYLTVAIGGSLALQALTMVFGPLRRFLGLTPPGLMDLAVLAATTVLPLVVNETLKPSKEADS